MVPYLTCICLSTRADFYVIVFLCPRNAWPPLQELIVTGLENTEEPKAIEIAKNLVHKWLFNVYESYDDSGQKMFEKYDVQRVRHFWKFQSIFVIV